MQKIYTISVDEEVMAQIELAAGKVGRNRSNFIEYYCNLKAREILEE